MSFELVRPEHLSTESWEAIESYRTRLASAAAGDDRPAVVGAAKELIECVARCVLDATENPLGDSAKFNNLVHVAQKTLERVAGKGIGTWDEVGIIAGAAQSIAINVNSLRNKVGTGHGRARVAHINDEMAQITADATMLWCRWALRRLGHLLAGYPNVLLAAVSSAVSRDRLRQMFDDVQMPDQPREIQHAIGVAFGREAAGGFGNAWDVGLNPATVSSDLDSFPVDYRLGLVEGMVITYGGQLGLLDSYVPSLVDVLVPVPSTSAAAALNDLAEKAESASWITRWRNSPFDPAATMTALDRERGRLNSKLQPALDRLLAAMDPATAPDPS